MYTCVLRGFNRIPFMDGHVQSKQVLPFMQNIDITLYIYNVHNNYCTLYSNVVQCTYILYSVHCAVCMLYSVHVHVYVVQCMTNVLSFPAHCPVTVMAGECENRKCRAAHKPVRCSVGTRCVCAAVRAAGGHPAHPHCPRGRYQPRGRETGPENGGRGKECGEGDSGEAGGDGADRPGLHGRYQ